MSRSRSFLPYLLTLVPRYILRQSFLRPVFLPCCCKASRVRLCATLETAAHQAPPSLGFSTGVRCLSPPLIAGMSLCPGAPEGRGSLRWEALELPSPAQSDAKTCGLALPQPGRRSLDSKAPLAVRDFQRRVGGGTRERGSRSEVGYHGNRRPPSR